MSASARSTEMESVKTRFKNIWMAGDYDRFSRYLESGARDFYERLNVAPGCQLLDVGCGSGQLALIAAKDGLEVTGVDIASNLVERARARAQAEGLRARFEEADAEALPFEDESFDVVEFFRLYYGPTNQAFTSLDADGRERLRRELEGLWSAHNRAGKDCTTVFAEYLEVIGIRT